MSYKFANSSIFIEQGGVQQVFSSGSSGRYMTGSTLNVTGATLIGFPSSSGNLFISPVVTGIGSPISTPHTLGVDPGAAGVMFSYFNLQDNSNPEITDISTSSTQVTATCTDGVTYKFLAIAP